ncbi:LysR family transcriptional regulator [Pengzhenrongella sicca]|uniref:LysR family transcriptional regulator n=1 Tax=Pengzhenrongella sicca TaxID=2819238 RepID=A0A8A4Z8H1_9MICO|nr:LysR family transcriptional regulator [Pengzhenrongella sicca]QTE28134.1 LysR family transcriptional regulator [Pengzhenrongella sicca]
MDLDLRSVRYFVTVADSLHFGRAAAQLYISQPALSKQIRKLEAQIGAPLLVRDSRHVVLTPRGQRFLEEARQLLLIAQKMQQSARSEVVRIAHVFELETSHAVADAYLVAHPTAELHEHAMDSVSQLDALLQDRLDVAILRITPGMLAAHPTGWSHCLLRLEPLVLVGRPGDESKHSAPLDERPLEVFADPPHSGSFNAHGEYLAALEEDVGITMRWVGTPGVFSRCLAYLTRTASQARSLEFLSYAERYEAAGLPVYWPEQLQPYYPWSLAWRSADPSLATADVLHAARSLALRKGWLEPAPHAAAPPWLPPDDPSTVEALGRRLAEPPVPIERAR